VPAAAGDGVVRAGWRVVVADGTAAEAVVAGGAAAAVVAVVAAGSSGRDG
jgi:hypothetical protein